MLKINQNEIEILDQCKKLFSSNTKIFRPEILECFDFASDIVTGVNGSYNQANAFAENTKRTSNEQFIDILQGKIAEFGLYYFLLKSGWENIPKPEMGLWAKGHWEDTDFTGTLNGITQSISLKSSKSKANLLMLECSRYTANGEYRENSSGGKPVRHDRIYFARVQCKNRKMLGEILSPDITEEMPRVFKNKNEIYDKLNKIFIEIEISGYITHNMFKAAIAENKIIHKGQRLGKKSIPLIADNYWFCLSELLSPTT